MDPEIKAALDKLFASDSSLYQTRGFQRRIGWGEKPALINIDLANAWTRENNAFTCEGMDTVIPAVQQVLAASWWRLIGTLKRTAENLKPNS